MDFLQPDCEDAAPPVVRTLILSRVHVFLMLLDLLDLPSNGSAIELHAATCEEARETLFQALCFDS